MTKNIKKVLVVLCTLFSWVGFAQEREVSGRVLDEDGLPIPGVTVSEDGTSNGTVTDMDGEFEFSVTDNENTTLIFSFLGFQTQEITLNGQTEFEIVLEESSEGLNEVVVVGYGTQKKANLTGAVSQVDSETLEDRPITNVSSGLQGSMAGVTVTGASGAPGNNSGDIRIRGIGTWGNASPLIVIDGVPGGNLDILNPSDIESISVLKDAASSSIYGVRGANGVIVVTTKSGKGGEPTLSYNTYYGMQRPTAIPEKLGSPEYMELLNESQINVGRNPTYSEEEIQIARDGSDPNYYANTNWVNEVYKDYAPQESHNLSVNGGEENLNYYLSYGLLKEGGLVVGDKFEAKRHNIRAKVSTTLLDRIELNTNLGYIDRNYTGSSQGFAPLYQALTVRPLVPVRNTNGGWGYIGGSSNPVATAYEAGTNDFTSEEFTANVDAAIRIFEGFKIRGRYGLVKYNSRRNVFDRTVNYYDADTGNLVWQINNPSQITTSSYKGTYQTFVGTAEFDRTFAEDHSVQALLGVSQEETINDDLSASRTDVASTSVGHINLGTDNQRNSGGNAQNALQSVFGRLNYAFKDKYLAEANFRYDGSSRFAKDVRWNLFSSASLGWVFTEEEFLENDILDFGKIRASYGTQGNDRIADWAFMDVLGPVKTMPIGNAVTIGYRQTAVGNELLTWESAEKLNVGLDLSFLDNRLNITADYFENNTNNILLRLPIPDVFGGPAYPYQNAGSVENTGLELELGWRDQIKEFNYDLNFNISDVRNEVTDLGGTEPTIGDRIRRVGEPLDAFYGLVADRIAQESDFTYDAGSDTYTPNFPYIQGDPVQPGDLIYKDLNGDGEVDLVNDRKVIGSHIPRYTYGFRGDFDYKNFDLSIFIQGVGKVNGLLTGTARHALISESAIPQAVHLDRWTPENTNASYPRLTYQQSYNQRLSTNWLEDASYIRLKNVQVGYTLPENFTSRFRVDRLRAYVSGENLLTFTDYFDGYDPESPVSSGSFYPQIRTFTVGLNINLK